MPMLLASTAADKDSVVFSQLCAVWLVVLVVSPFTAPFRTCDADFSGVFSPRTAHVVAPTAANESVADDGSSFAEWLGANRGRCRYAHSVALHVDRRDPAPVSVTAVLELSPDDRAIARGIVVAVLRV